MPKTNRQELKEVLEELTIYYIQGLRAHAQDIVLSREYSFKGSRRSYAQGLRVQIVLKISYETTDRICVHHAEQGVYEALREIEYKD